MSPMGKAGAYTVEAVLLIRVLAREGQIREARALMIGVALWWIVAGPAVGAAK